MNTIRTKKNALLCDGETEGAVLEAFNNYYRRTLLRDYHRPIGKNVIWFTKSLGALWFFGGRLFFDQPGVELVKTCAGWNEASFQETDLLSRHR